MNIEQKIKELLPPDFKNADELIIFLTTTFEESEYDLETIVENALYWISD